MSDWNSLENSLRRWTPRQPSRELRERIFEPRGDWRGTTVRVPDLVRWLVPALGCFLLMFTTLSSRYPVHQVFPLAMTNLLLSDSSNTYNEVVVAARADHSDVNCLPARRLEWSFGARPATGAFGSVLASYTNKLIQ